MCVYLPCNGAGCFMVVIASCTLQGQSKMRAMHDSCRCSHHPCSYAVISSAESACRLCSSHTLFMDHESHLQICEFPDGNVLITHLAPQRCETVSMSYRTNVKFPVLDCKLPHALRLLQTQCHYLTSLIFVDMLGTIVNMLSIYQHQYLIHSLVYCST